MSLKKFHFYFLNMIFHQRAAVSTDHKQELKKVEAKIIWYNYIIIFAPAVKVHRNK